MTWLAVTRKRLEYFQNAFFGKIPGAIGKQTNKTAKQTNTYLRLICCTCTKRAFLKSDSFFLDVSEFGYEYVSHTVLFPLNHIYLFTRTPNGDLKQILNNTHRQLLDCFRYNFSSELTIHELQPTLWFSLIIISLREWKWCLTLFKLSW